MHEFAIAQGLVKAVLAEMRKHRVRPGALRAAKIAIGAMHQVLPGTLTFAYETLVQDTPAAGSKLKLRHVPVTAHCAACGWQGPLTMPLFLCDACQARDVETLTGMELHLERLEVEERRARPRPQRPRAKQGKRSSSAKT